MIEGLARFIADKISMAHPYGSDDTLDVYLYLSHKGYPLAGYRVDVKVINRQDSIWVISKDIPPRTRQYELPPPRSLAHISLKTCSSYYRDAMKYYDDIVTAAAHRMAEQLTKTVFEMFLEKVAEGPIEIT